MVVLGVRVPAGQGGLVEWDLKRRSVQNGGDLSPERLRRFWRCRSSRHFLWDAGSAGALIPSVLDIPAHASLVRGASKRVSVKYGPRPRITTHRRPCDTGKGRAMRWNCRPKSTRGQKTPR